MAASGSGSGASHMTGAAQLLDLPSGSSSSQPSSDVVSSNSSSEHFSGSEDICEEKTPRWVHGCMAHYMSKGGCRRKTCPFLHDLRPKEADLLKRSCSQSGHVVFSSNSSEVKSVGSRSSGGAGPRNSGDFVGLLEPGSPASVVEGPGDIDLWRRHSAGECKPCFFYHMTEEGCPAGADCRFCHFPHEDIDTSRVKLRPCKGKRERARKFFERVAREIQENPSGFRIEEVVLPSALSKPDVVRRQALEKISEMIVEVHDLRMGVPLGESTDIRRALDDDPAPRTWVDFEAAAAAAGVFRSRKNIVSL